MAGPWSVCGDLADFDDFLPAREFRGLERRELLGRVADDLEAELEELRLRRRIVQASDDRIAEPGLDVVRKALGRRERLPRVDGDALEAELFHRRDVGQQRRALGAGDRERTELAALH